MDSLEYFWFDTKATQSNRDEKKKDKSSRSISKNIMFSTGWKGMDLNYYNEE